MYQTLLFAIGYGALFRLSMVSFEYLNTYMRYGIDPHFPSMRLIVNSKYTPVCLALGYLRVLFQEPVFDHLIKKMYCS